MRRGGGPRRATYVTIMGPDLGMRRRRDVAGTSESRGAREAKRSKGRRVRHDFSCVAFVFIVFVVARDEVNRRV